MNVYLISGLGADHRIFSKLEFDQSFQIIHINWIDFSKKDTLKGYAQKLSRVIETSKPFALIGVSFGGMIAIEMAKLLKPQVTIVISSILYSNQRPALYNLFAKSGLLNLIPGRFLKFAGRFTRHYYFGTRLPEAKQLLNKIIADTDPAFLKWAIKSILTWKNEVTSNNVFQLHGAEDKIFPIKKVSPHFTISNGGHFMVYQQAAALSVLINKLLLSVTD